MAQSGTYPYTADGRWRLWAGRFLATFFALAACAHVTALGAWVRNVNSESTLLPLLLLAGVSAAIAVRLRDLADETNQSPRSSVPIARPKDALLGELKASLRRARRSREAVGLMLVETEQAEDYMTRRPGAGSSSARETVLALLDSLLLTGDSVHTMLDGRICVIAAGKDALDRLLHIADRSQSALRARFQETRAAAPDDVYFGISQSRGSGTSPEALLRGASLAVARAKVLGPGRFVVAADAA